MTYTYIFRYTGGTSQPTVIRNLSDRLTGSQLNHKFCQFKMPTGSILINMNNVTTVEEIINSD